MRLRGVRADSGFCLPELLALWEQLRLPYIVVAKLSEPIQNLLRHDVVWTPTELAGTDVAEVEYQALGWPHPAPADPDPAPRGRAAGGRRQETHRCARLLCSRRW